MELEGFQPLTAIFGPGVYALVWRRQVVYVGQSKQLIRRIMEHRWNALRYTKKLPGWSKVKAIQFDDLWIRPTPLIDLDRVEREMIAKYRPRHNDRLLPKTGTVAGMVINGVVIGSRPAMTLERRI